MSNLRQIPITEEQRSIMMHALGSSHKGAKLGFRNYYMCDHNADMEHLCSNGFMVMTRPGGEVLPDNCYVVTDEAKKMLGVKP